MNTIKIGKNTIQIKEEWKFGFFSVWIFGLLAHAYRFFNLLPTWDSMYNFKGTGGTFHLGRCFLEFFGSLPSKYDMPWVNGALSLLYISVVVVLLTDLFKIKGHLSAALLGGLIVTFPTVTSTFAYMFTADAYMIAFLLSVLGVYLTYKWKYGIWPGMVCICLSIGTYQAYISVALVLVVMIVIQDLLLEKKTFREMFFSDVKYMVLMLGGAGGYKVASTIINWHYEVILSDYQGIGRIGILTLPQYKAALFKIIRALDELWCISAARLGGGGVYWRPLWICQYPDYLFCDRNHNLFNCKK